MENHPSATRPSQGPCDSEAFRAALFGNHGARGYLPSAISLMSGEPTPAELEEAAELLALAQLVVRRWSKAVKSGDRVRIPTGTTERMAVELLPQLVGEISALSVEQPTTDEIQRVLDTTVPALQRLLRDWVTSRHLIQAQAIRAAEFSQRHPHVVVVMARHAPKGGIHPVLSDLVSPFVQRRQS